MLTLTYSTGNDTHSIFNITQSMFSKIMIFFITTILVLFSGAVDVGLTSTLAKTKEGKVIIGQHRSKIDKTTTKRVKPTSREDLIISVAEIIKEHEGFSPKPYQDIDGWAQGYGQRVDGPDQKPITKSQAHKRLIKELNYICNYLDERLPWWNKLDGPRKEAMINLTYNVGAGGIIKFENFLAALQVDDYYTAAYEILYTNGEPNTYWNQVGVRAVQVAYVIMKGKWNLNVSELRIFNS